MEGKHGINLWKFRSQLQPRVFLTYVPLMYWIKGRVKASEVPTDTPLFPRSKSKACGRINLLKHLLRLFRATWDEFWHLLFCVCPLHSIRFAYKSTASGRTRRQSSCQPTQTSGSMCLRLSPWSLSEQYQAPVATCFSRAGCSLFPETSAGSKSVLFHPFWDFIFKEWELVRTSHAKNIPTTT